MRSSKIVPCWSTQVTGTFCFWKSAAKAFSRSRPKTSTGMLRRTSSPAKFTRKVVDPPRRRAQETRAMRCWVSGMDQVLSGQVADEGLFKVVGRQRGGVKGQMRLPVRGRDNVRPFDHGIGNGLWI